MSSEQLEQFITQLRRQLVNLGGIAEYMVRDSIESVVERNSDLAQRVIKRDDEADLFENNIPTKDIFYQAYNPQKGVGSLVCKICDPSAFK